MLVVASASPETWQVTVPGLVGLRMTDAGVTAWTLVLYTWPVLSMLLARVVHDLEGRRVVGRLSTPLLYVVGYGPLLCAITLAAYVRQWRGAAQTWDKTEKTGRVAG